jgi:hypothetical protein
MVHWDETPFTAIDFSSVLLFSVIIKIMCISLDVVVILRGGEYIGWGLEQQ